MADYKEKYMRALKELDEAEHEAADNIQALYQVLLSILGEVKGHHKSVDEAIHSLPKALPNNGMVPIDKLSVIRELMASYFDKDDMGAAATILSTLLSHLKVSDDLHENIEALEENLAKARTEKDLQAVTHKVSREVLRALSANKAPSDSASSMTSIKAGLLLQLEKLEELDSGLAESIKVAGLHNLLERMDDLPGLGFVYKETFDVLGRRIVKKNEFIVELSGLIETVMHKLAELSVDLKQEGINEVDAIKDRWRLTELMGGQINTLQDSVLQTESLSTLKSLLTEQLGEFNQTVTDFAELEEHRANEAEEYAQSVSNRLKKLESEAEELKLSLLQAHEEALIDVLTGVANRRAFDERIRLEFERWKRNKEPLVLAVLDIDRFKKINDTYGHSVGDKVLCTISQLINKQVRNSDFFGRVGGEEFAVIFTGSDVDNAIKRLNQFRASVEDCKFGYQGKRLTITLSAGCALFADEDTPDSVYKRADQALYRAKESGRNKCLSEREI
ncbi:MAG: GGDEF domain-containing protein [Cycloclasticus sp.]|nr:GGDEF domain-containing protein [Cycloclasticus sp.]